LNKKEYFKYIDYEGTERIRIRITIDKGKVTDILLQYETLYYNKWIPIVRYDCSHGYFHRDFIYPKGNKEKYTIAIKNLEDALLYAEQDLKDRWKLYKQKYIRNLKK
jgi:hypothetical protein